MNKDDIRDLALAVGFKKKLQADGSMDLNPYVYDFVQKLLTKHNDNLFHEIRALRQQTESGAKGRRDCEVICKCLDVIQHNQDTLNPLVKEI